MRLAIAWHAVATPRDRDVHAVAIPRMGGLAMLGGVVLAIGVANMLPTLQSTFTNPGADIGWIVISGVLICLLGVLDDRFELDSLTKLAGQVLVTGVMVTKGGVQLAAVYLPWGHTGTVVLGRTSRFRSRSCWSCSRSTRSTSSTAWTAWPPG